MEKKYLSFSEMLLFQNKFQQVVFHLSVTVFGNCFETLLGILMNILST